MAYTIISQNNSTTTLSDGVNTITVPSRVNLTSGNFTIVEVNNNMATLEDGDGNVYRDIPCVATLAGEGGGGGSALPDQTGHSGEFLTTDGTDASWSDKPLVNKATGTNGIGIGGSSLVASGNNSIAVGSNPQATASATIAIGLDARATVGDGIAIGDYARSNANKGYQIGTGTNNTRNSFQVGAYQLLNLEDGTIPTARFTTDPVSDGTYVPTLTIASGVATRSWSAPSGGLPSQTGNAGKFLTTDGTDASWSDKPLVNTATGSNSLAIEGAATGGFAIVIGYYASCTNTSFANCVAIGNGAFSGLNSVSIGNSSTTDGTGCISIGKDAKTQQNYSLTIGYYSKATATGAIQLGNSPNLATPLVNSDANTFKVGNANGNFEIMDANGNLPADRLASTTGLADGNYRLRLTMASGVPTLSWVAE